MRDEVLEFLVVRLSWFLIIAAVLSTFLYLLHIKINFLFIILLVGLFFCMLLYGLRAEKRFSFDKKQLVMLLIIVAVSATAYAFHHEPFISDTDAGLFGVNALKFFYTGDLVNHGFPTYSILISLPLFISDRLFDVYIMNSLFIALGLGLMFYSMRKISAKWWVQLSAVILVAVSYPFLWFSRQTLTEVLWFFLFFMVIYYLLKYHDEKDEKYILFLMAPLLLSLALRIEAFILLAIVIVCLLLGFARRKNFRNLLSKFSDNGATLVLLAVILVMVVSVIVVKNEVNYISSPLEKIFVNSFQNSNLGIINKVEQPNYSTAPPTYKNYILQYTIQSFEKYFLLLPLILVLLYFVTSHAKRYMLHRQAGLSSLGVLSAVIVVFFLIFIFEPSTGFTHPWFLRHFWVPVITLSLMLYPAVIDSVVRSSRIKAVVIVLSIALTIMVSLPVIAFSEYSGSYSQMKNISDFIYKEHPGIYSEQNLVISEDAFYRNYGQTFANLINAQTITLDQLKENNSYLNFSNKFIFARDVKLSGFSVPLLGHEIDNLLCTQFEVERLDYIKDAHLYAQNWLMPAVHLPEGYGGFESTIKLLPPRDKLSQQLLFCVYSLE